MDCIKLELANKKIIEFNVKEDQYRCSNEHIKFIFKNKPNVSLICDCQTIKNFVRRIEAAREDKLIDCTDLHGMIA